MVFQGTEYLRELSQQPHFSAKMVFNSNGALVFPVSLEHRDRKAPGITYEDNHKGNALAAMLGPGKIEVRYHSKFSDSQVSSILHTLTNHTDLAALNGATVTYQGRPLKPTVK